MIVDLLIGIPAAGLALVIGWALAVAAADWRARTRPAESPTGEPVRAAEDVVRTALAHLDH
ncbi:MAG: hypothetical protein HOY79_34260 [Streptomyces sp.]|nr:hypothetical protein [Streptomyces sp.]NUS11378.1 hypothetical protein [Streptomyces sp.]NUS23481.1 hypothetical protein [Streptomyces sp.]